MVIAIAGAGIIIIVILIAGIILKRVPAISSVLESEIPEFSYKNPFYKKLFKLIASKQKVITVSIITKAIRRLKIISLKTDNLSTKLLEKIRSSSDDEDGKMPM